MVEATRLTYRPELDGIRAIAVAAVLVYHLDRSWLPGGYLGVDVFFTLSGFLITTLLVTEHRGAGRIDLPAFWSRRARRLLPASITALVSIAIWLWFQSDADQAARRGDVVATVLNVANWRLIATGESYFEHFAAPSPIRHFWSLAIEEQFYLVWPAACAAVLTFTAGRTRRRQRALGGVAAALAAASALWCAVAYDADDPSRAYFGTDTRMHQLLVGCLLAVWLHDRPPRGAPAARSPVARRWTLVAAGASCGLAAAFVWLADDISWYYRGGSVAVAVIAAALILALESGGGGGVRWLLRTRPVVAVGRVSYGLYVWHWPIYIWLPAGTWGLDSGLPISVARLAVTAVVAAVSYHVLESPIRRGAWPAIARPRNVALGSGGAVAGVLVLVVAATWGATTPEWARASGEAGHASFTPVRAATARVAIIGDSVSVSLLPGLRADAGARGWELIEAAERSCPLTGFHQALDDGTPSPKNDVCPTEVARLRAEVIALEPDVVIWHDLQSSWAILEPGGTVIPSGSAEWTERTVAGWTSVAGEFRAADIDVVVIVPPMRSPRPLGDCRDDALTPRCELIQEQDAEIRAATEAFLGQHADDRGVQGLTLDSVLCPSGPPCPAQIDGVTVRIQERDFTHFTEEGALWIAPVILDAAASALE